MEAECSRYQRRGSLWLVYSIRRFSAIDVSSVSQFTLLASTKKGNKPDFHGTAGPDQARELYDYFYTKVQELYDVEKVKNGVFQALMEGVYFLAYIYHLITTNLDAVNIQNSGPVSVDYICRDEAVPIGFYQILNSH